jgi:hypothetical protein
MVGILSAVCCWQRCERELIISQNTLFVVYCGSWFEHVQSFWRFSKVNDKVLFVKYEDMKAVSQELIRFVQFTFLLLQNLRSEVSRVAGFLEMREQLSPEVLDRVTRHCTFSTMKENRMANRAGVWLFDQSISKFMRKGRIASEGD